MYHDGVRGVWNGQRKSWVLYGCLGHFMSTSEYTLSILTYSVCPLFTSAARMRAKLPEHILAPRTLAPGNMAVLRRVYFLYSVLRAGPLDASSAKL